MIRGRGTGTDSGGAGQHRRGAVDGAGGAVQRAVPLCPEAGAGGRRARRPGLPGLAARILEEKQGASSRTTVTFSFAPVKTAILNVKQTLMKN